MLPSHSQALLCLQRGLFNGLSRFAQLEERLAGLSDAEQRVGFAVFAEAMLAIRTVPQAADIWAEGVVPAEARRRYGLPERVPGADGLLRTLTGDLHPYQLLYRPERAPLNRKELSAFLELAERVPQPLLISNAPALPAALRSRTDFHAILAPDLERLNSRDFAALRRWLQGIGMVPERQPLPTPLARLLARLNSQQEQQDRLLVQVAPGLDLPLLALKWAESQGAGRSVLVVVPSLTALRELLLHWRRHLTWNDVATLWLAGEVGSGPDVSQLQQADFDLPLVNESEGIRRFLNGRFSGVRVILAPYNGLRLLARALIGSAPIDAGLLLDGREVTHDPFFLENQHLPLCKRLLLTPALRQLNPLQRDSEGEGKLLWNLQENPLCGHTLPLAPLAQAVQEGLLRPWQLWIVLVPPAWIGQDEAARVRLLCQTLRTVLATAKTVRHVQVLHGSLPELRTEAAFDPLLCQSLAGKAEGPRSDWLSCALEASMTAAEREQMVRRYLTAPQAVLHAARALLDGLTLPQADLLLCSPYARKVKWDLPRALAAVLRKAPLAGAPPELAPGQPGILCVPVLAAPLTGQGGYASAEHALLGSDLLWEVLQRLREVDGAFDRQIVASAEQWGRKGAFPWQPGADPALAWHGRIRFLLPEGIAEGWRQEVWPALFHRLSHEWDRRFGQWQGQQPEQAAQRSEWEEQQRKFWKKGLLRDDRRQRLQEAGFVWDPKQLAWEGQLAALQTFVARHGHAEVPATWPENPALAEWVQLQRRDYFKGRLSAEAVQRLQEISFVWDPEQQRWDQMFDAFVLFRQQQGHGKVPEMWPEEPELAQWATEQRKEWAKGKLATERQVRLQEWEFCWDLQAAWWEEQFAALLRFQEQEGHLLVPSSWSEDPHLADWVSKQRRDWRAERLPADRLQRLQEVGFVWDPEELAWQQQWSALLAFHARQQHCHVPESEGALAEWVRQQRKAAQAGQLSAARRELLQSISFIFDPRAAEWDAMLLALRQFRQERNHCIIPANDPDHPALSRWVSQVRRAYAAQQLTATQMAQLNELGFVWDAKAVLWEELFAALAEFRRLNGNCLVPESYPANPQLAWWVVAQRKAYKSGQLEAERVERLNKLGFFWDPLEVQWYEMYVALVHYRQQYGRVVITRGTADARLSSWVATQRQARQHGNLTAKRIELLDSLGFVWDQKEVVVQEMLAELALFRERHGHCHVPVPLPSNPALGLWVQFQRQEYKKGTLDPERIQRLQALGFVWE
ncbi:MAG: helicase associated domain-containing protein [Magnetococcales bacterium]|nr:helicase associated domain-containing protein [Magnetococcales bacterium]